MIQIVNYQGFFPGLATEPCCCWKGVGYCLCGAATKTSLDVDMTLLALKLLVESGVTFNIYQHVVLIWIVVDFELIPKTYVKQTQRGEDSVLVRTYLQTHSQLKQFNPKDRY